MFIENGVLKGITQEEALQETLVIPKDVRKFESLRIRVDEGEKEESEVVRELQSLRIGSDEGKKEETEKTGKTSTCNVKNLIIEGEITLKDWWFGVDASSMSKVKKISFLDSSQELNIDFLSRLESLQEIEISNPQYYVENGVVYNSDKTMLIYYCQGKEETSYTAPATLTGMRFECFSRKNGKNRFI